MNKTDPFTRTPGVAGEAFIDMHYSDIIFDSFESDYSSKYVYKIVGLRGSGKSVEYRKIINAFSQKKDWLVYTLSAAGTPINTLISKLSKEPFINSSKHSTTISAGGSADFDVIIAKGDADISAARTTEEDTRYYSEEAALTEMIQKANDAGYKVLIGIDDIAKTPDMVKFLSIWGSMLLDDKKRIYFICTGLAKNIEDFSDEPSLTFFKRSDYIEVKALDRYEIASMYQKLLNINSQEAIKLSKFTCGYAYAYQVLGSLYCNRRPSEKLDSLIPQFDKILFRDSYDLIWKSLTKAEKEFIKIVFKTNHGKTSEIRANMRHPNSYSSLRHRLENKHIINTEDYGYVKINLPRFKEYIILWYEDDFYATTI